MSKKIIASLGLLTALWLGATAYMSSNTQSYLNAYVAKSNNLYAQKGMQFSVEKFEKGFFSSKATMKIDFVEPTLRELVSQSIKLPLKINYSIENGPIFFKKGLGMGASRMHSHLKLSDHVVDKEAYAKVFTEDVEVDALSTVSLFNNAKVHVQSSKIVANLEATQVKVTPLIVDGNFNVKTFEGEMKVFIESISMDKGTDTFNANNLLLDADISKFYDNGFYLGSFLCSVEAMSAKGEALPFELSDAKAKFLVDIDENADKTVNIKFKFNGDVGNSKLPVDYATLQEINLDYAITGMKLKGVLEFQDFTKRLQLKQQELMNKLTASKGAELDMKALEALQNFQENSQDEMMLMMAGVLESNRTNFTFETNMVDNKKHKSLLSMNLGYVGDELLPTDSKELSQKFKNDFLDLLKLDFKVDIEKAYLENLPAKFQEQLAGQLQMGAMFGFVQENNNSFGFNANYEPKRLSINGQDRTKMLQMLGLNLFR